MKTLDLHGTKHEKAEAKIEDFILLNNCPIRIITGNSLTMKNYVEQIARKHDLETRAENHFNLGSLIIYEI